MTRKLCILMLAFAALIGACGKGGEELASDGVTVTEDTSKEPKVTIPTGVPPTTMVSRDIVSGDGAEAAATSTVKTHYYGVLWTEKRVFGTSWDGQPLDFPLGKGQVIKGWDLGVPGMKVGGRRLLIVPPDLGYGPGGREPIPGNATLVFVVDLLEVT